jgi:X-X-X-Leu-X-X-Gly heptad repeat protein
VHKLNPKQKKIAAAAAVGAVLALFVLIRGKKAGGGTQDATANPATGSGLPADYGAGAGGTFADNGASAGQLSSSVADLAGGVQQLRDDFGVSLSAQAEAQTKANEGLREQLRVLGESFSQRSAPGPAGDVGQPSGNAGSGALAAGAQTPAAASSRAPAGVAPKSSGWSSTMASRAAAPPPNQFVQKSGTRAGQTYTVIKKGGKSYRRYPNGDTIPI